MGRCERREEEMIVNVELSHNSIKNAIKQLKKFEKHYVGFSSENSSMQKFLERCYYRIIEIANRYIDALEGFEEPEIKNSLKTGWSMSIIGGMLTVTNDNDKAVFLEFGVGLVGEGSPHPQASEENYNYNIPTDYKKADGTWQFKTHSAEEPVDLKRRNYEIKPLYRGQRLLISTKGNEAGLYAYNALMDFVMNNEGQRIWEELNKEQVAWI